MIQRRFIQFAVVFLLFHLGILSGCMDSTTQTQSNLNDAIVLIDENIVIPPVISEKSVVYYRGTIQNTATSTIRKLTVTATFYDEQNTSLGSKETTLDNVKSKEERNFSIPITSDDAYYEQIHHVMYDFTCE